MCDSFGHFKTHLNHTWDQKFQQLVCHENLISTFSSIDVWVQTSFGIRASEDTHSAHKVKDESPLIPSSFYLKLQVSSFQILFLQVSGHLLWGPPSSVLTAAQKMDKELFIFISIAIYDLMNTNKYKRLYVFTLNGRRNKRVESALIPGVTSHMKGELSYIYFF